MTNKKWKAVIKLKTTKETIVVSAPNVFKAKQQVSTELHKLHPTCLDYVLQSFTEV